MKKDSFYFPHDSNAKDDPKCTIMIFKKGLEYYGIFWVLIELCRDQPEYKYPLELIPAIAQKYNTTFEKVKEVIFDFGLFQVDESNFFFSNSLVERMAPLEQKRIQASHAGKLSAQKRLQISTCVQQTFNACSTDVQPKRVEESKEEKKRKDESKVKEINRDTQKNVKHSFDQSPYFNLNYLINSMDEKYKSYDLEFYHEVAKNYSLSSNTKYANWLAAIRNWIMRDVTEGRARAHKPTGTEADKKAERLKKITEAMEKLNAITPAPGG
jgi:Asp-tRNA(Asn)/Glu-tRNA(Gln) amidotransferase C subunit